MPYQADQYRNTSQLPPEKIIAWIKKHFDYKTRKEGREYLINNPFNHDTKYHLNINPFKGKCHDWRGDEWAGPTNPTTNRRNCSFIKFVRLYKKLKYSEALADVLGTSVDIRYYLKPENRVTDEGVKSKSAIKLPIGAEPLLASEDSQAKTLINWLGSRGYSDEEIIKNDIHHLGMDVYWPYYEFDTLVYWQSRSRLNKRFNFPSLNIYDEAGKVIGLASCSKGDFLYGFDDIEPASYVIITEAIFDKHTLGSQTVASGGAILTANQIGKLKILGPKRGVILSPDNDVAGLKSIIANYQQLTSNGFHVYCSIPPTLQYKKSTGADVKTYETKDWNELGQYVVGFKEVRKLHDANISKLNEQSLIKIYDLIDSLTSKTIGRVAN